MEGNIMSSVRAGYPGRVITVSLGLLLFALATLTPLLAQAPPSGDTFVSSSYPNNNFGFVNSLAVAPGNISYLQFNLSVQSLLKTQENSYEAPF
jgi:hypothetical protein